MTYVLSERKLSTIPKLLENVETVEQWQAKRSSIEAAWHKLLGKPPAAVADTGSTAGYEVVGESSEGNHTRLDIRYRTGDGDIVAAYLLIPNRASGRSGGKLPAVLAMHPTSAAGRDDISTPAGRENRMYALELAERGYVVLAPDSITFGSRIYPGMESAQTSPFYRQHPDSTVVAKMLADHKRALDVLGSVEQADPARIGVIGHSLGGYNGWFLAGMDERVKAVVSSCGFSVFTDDPEPNRWGRRDWFTHFPAVTDWLESDRIPFEWHEIAALAAPTPTFMWSGLSDRIFPNWAAIAAGMNDLDGLYRFLGAGDRFQFVMGTAGHDFPASIREMAYRFLDRWLDK